MQPYTSTDPGPTSTGNESQLWGPKEKHNHPNHKPKEHPRPERAAGEPSLWVASGTKRWDAPGRPHRHHVPFPPITPGSISTLSSQLQPTPLQSLNQQIITLTLQMFNFLLQLHRFCSRKGGSWEQMKTSWVFPNKPRAALTPSGCPLRSPDRDGGHC